MRRKAQKPVKKKPTSVAACRSCGVVLDPPPSRSRKCPECGEKIVVRTDPKTKEKLFLTSEGAAQFDAAKAAASAKKKALRQVEAMGLAASDYDAKSAELAQEWGHAPNSGDVYWSLANEQIARLGNPRRNGVELSHIYTAMAQQLQQEGRSYHHRKKEAHKASLIWEKEQVKKDAKMYGDDPQAWRAEIMANGCCDVCKVLDGRSYTFEQAIEELPLPPEECTRDWCNCGWMRVHPD